MLVAIVRLDIIAINENCARLAFYFNMNCTKKEKPCSVGVSKQGYTVFIFSIKNG